MTNNPSGLSNEEIKRLLDSCASEPIQFLGQIQNFCSLLAFDRETGRITDASQNFDLFGASPDSMLGTNIKDYLGETQYAELASQFPSKIFKDLVFDDLEFAGQKLPTVVAHTTQKKVVLEFELKNQPLDMADKVSLLNSIIPRQSAKSSKENELHLLEQLAEGISDLTQFDRVMIYKFHPDLHGEVVAEKILRPELESFLGLHYPESDIPRQARKLYLRNRVRLIESIVDKPVNIISDSDKVIDLSDSMSRHVSPVHIEYLNNMGVRASMSISIVVKGELWGLIACHHYDTKYINFVDRAFLKLISYSLSSYIENRLEFSLARRQSELKKLIEAVLETFDKGRVDEPNPANTHLEYALKTHSRNLLGLLNASGFYIEVGGQVVSLGDVPSEKAMDAIKKWTYEREDSRYSTQSLSEISPSLADDSSKCCGMIALSIGEVESSGFVAWFRPEFTHEVKWAGADEKQVKLVNGVRRLSPRGSFELYLETQRNRSLPFTKEDEMVVSEFIWFINEVLAQRLSVYQTKTEELEGLSKAKDQFISTLSHELRTPLNNILGWLQLFEPKFNRDEGLKELYQTIEKNSLHQLRLVEDLLDISRLANGKMKITKLPVDIHELVADAIHSFEPRYQKKGVRLKFNFPKENVVGNIDQLRMSQVIRNVLENSLKFTPKGGTVEVILNSNDQKIFLTVVDSGIGIDSKEINGLFLPFEQANMSKARKAGGVGLGLSIAKEIVRLHGGEISVESEGKNMGTQVLISLEYGKPSVTAEKRKKKQKAVDRNKTQSHLKGKRVLLVEDTEESARFLTLFMESVGLKVVWTEQGLEALKILEQNQIDLVLSDIGMPDMDGYQFIKLAKQIPNAKDISFVAISAYARPEEIDKSMEVGFAEHIVKPVRLEELIEKIENLLEPNGQE